MNKNGKEIIKQANKYRKNQNATTHDENHGNYQSSIGISIGIRLKRNIKTLRNIILDIGYKSCGYDVKQHPIPFL